MQSESSTFSAEALRLAKTLESGPVIRTVNFHNTPRSRAGEYERQLAQYARRFSGVSQADLEGYLATGRWTKSKPGLIVAVYEGYRNGYDVLLPLIERHGFVGWFFVITGFVNAPVGEQLAFARGHGIGMQTTEYADGRYALTWQELRKIDRSHVVASHARSHTRFALLDETTRESEILGAQRDFEAGLGHPVGVFVSRGGPAHGEHADTGRLVAQAGYRLVFSNFKVQRVRSGERA